MADSIAPPSRREIDSIIALDAQPVLRNLKITQCYHDLSCALAGLLGVENLNWCSFAAWASKTAGRFVRGELLAIFRDVLQSEPRIADEIDRINTLLRRFGAVFDRPAIVAVIETPVEAVSRHIAAGNLAVFTELAPLFSRLCAALAQTAEYKADNLVRLLVDFSLKAGASEVGGQDLLRGALSHFYQAKFECQADRKAELMLLANAQTGLHEQVRLQPAIAGALALPFDAALRELVVNQIGSNAGGFALQRLRRLASISAEPLIAEFSRELNRLWRECVTKFFMTLGLPEGEIHLGKDLRPLPGKPLYPASLASIENSELLALLASYRVAGMGAAESGATDWADLAERMHFILTLFRARQQGQRLFEEPFTDAQRCEIDQNRMPSGAL
jgi:hypothetical protein